ncbi:hypothetical protein MMC22_001698 [Lobaria immixta]|nr:hypothetical protein [Lobaria immixta]
MHLHSSLILLCGAFGLPSRAYPTRDSTSFKPLTSRVCGTGSPSEGLRSAHHKLHARHRLHTRQTASSPIVVDTYIHFVTTEDQAPYYTGNVVSTLIGNQAAVLSRAYAPANISFRWLQPTYTINNGWATDADSKAMKPALRNGTYSTLNLYFQTNLSTPWTTPTNTRALLLGYCTLPSPQCNTPPCTASSSSWPFSSSSFPPPSPDGYINDGCNIHAGSLPGGMISGYNLGGTAVHEVGHWFGLMHTFQGESCSPTNPGDYIDDTKQEAAQTAGCPTNKDTCPQLPGGGDPVSNYMDYSSDEW